MSEESKERLDSRALQKLDDITDLRKLDPQSINLSRLRDQADLIKEYLKDESKDPYTIAVKSRGAMNSVSECLRVVSAMYGYLKSESSREYAIAKIERADEWFKKNKPDAKLSDGLRSTYADMDEKYIEVKRKETAAKSLLIYLQNKYNDFQSDHWLAKKRLGNEESEEGSAGFSNLKEEEFEG